MPPLGLKSRLRFFQKYFTIPSTQSKQCILNYANCKLRSPRPSLGRSLPTAPPLLTPPPLPHCKPRHRLGKDSILSLSVSQNLPSPVSLTEPWGRQLASRKGASRDVLRSPPPPSPPRTHRRTAPTQGCKQHLLWSRCVFKTDPACFNLAVQVCYAFLSCVSDSPPVPSGRPWKQRLLASRSPSRGELHQALRRLGDPSSSFNHMRPPQLSAHHPASSPLCCRLGMFGLLL